MLSKCGGKRLRGHPWEGVGVAVGVGVRCAIVRACKHLAHVIRASVLPPHSLQPQLEPLRMHSHLNHNRHLLNMSYRYHTRSLEPQLEPQQELQCPGQVLHAVGRAVPRARRDGHLVAEGLCCLKVTHGSELLDLRGGEGGL